MVPWFSHYNRLFEIRSPKIRTWRTRILRHLFALDDRLLPPRKNLTFLTLYLPTEWSTNNIENTKLLMLKQLFVRITIFSTPTPWSPKWLIAAPSLGSRLQELPVLCVLNVNRILLMPRLLSNERIRINYYMTFRTLTDSWLLFH